jgi:HK97 family phage major capsid protein
MDRLKEIEKRLAEIKVELEKEGADIDALEQEVKTLTEERKQLLEKIEKRNKIIKDIADGAGTPVPDYLPTEERKDEPKGPDSPVYRTAFLKRLLGQPLTEAEKREFTLVPPTAAAAVPTQTYNKIFDQMTKIAPMLSNITLLRVPGNLRLAVQGVRNPAQAHQELDPVNPAADTLVSVNLTGYEFIKVLRISATIRAMAIDAFEDWLAKTLGEDLAVAIDNEIINGPTVSGDIANAQVWNAGVNYVQYQNNISYEDICNCIAMLPSAFDANAKWLMNKATFYQQIMQITDANGNLIAIQSLADGGAWRIMGYPVLIDDNVDAGVVYFGDFTKVVGNLSQDIRVESSAESGFLNNAIDFRGTAIFDCNIAQPTAITKIDVPPQSQD